MKHIAILDSIIANRDGAALKACGIDREVFRDYERSVEENLDDLDFDDIWSMNFIPSAVKSMREFGFERFTVSAPTSALAKIVYEFQKCGCKLIGTKVVQTAEFSPWREDKIGFVMEL